MKNLGVLDANIYKKDISRAEEILTKLEKNIDQEVQDRQQGYFYTNSTQKWYEIAAWSWFGVLVGIIFYVAKQLKLGIFDRHDIPTIWGEIIMAPIVTWKE